MKRSFADCVKPAKARMKRWSRLRRRTIKNWWDLENGPVPKEIQVRDIYQRLREGLQTRTRIGYRGRLQVKAIVGFSNSVTRHVKDNLGGEIEFETVFNKTKPPKTAGDQVADVAIREDIDKWLVSQLVNRWILNWRMNRRGSWSLDNAMITSGDAGFAEDIYVLRHFHHHTMVAYTIGHSGFGSHESWHWRVLLGLPPDVSDELARRRKNERNRLRRKQNPGLRVEKITKRIRENPIDAVFGKEEDEAIGGDSDSDDAMEIDVADGKRKALSESDLVPFFERVKEEDHSVEELSSLLFWYRAACLSVPEPSGNNQTVDRVITFVLNNAYPIFQKRLSLSPTWSKENVSVKDNQEWNSLEPLVKSFFTSTSHLVNNEAANLATRVNAITKLKDCIALFAVFPVLLKKFIEISVDLLATTGEAEAYLSKETQQILQVISVECYDTCLIKLYAAFLRECNTPKAGLSSLRDSIVWICSQNPHKSSTKASVSIRHLEDLLQKASMTKQKIDREKIHCEQYTNMVDLWVRIIAANVQDNELKSLMPKLLKLIKAVVKLFKEAKYLFLRVKCVYWLNQLSLASASYDSLPKMIELVLDVLHFPTEVEVEVEEEGEEHETENEVEEEGEEHKALELPKIWLKSQDFRQQCVASVSELLDFLFAQWREYESCVAVVTSTISSLRVFSEKTTTAEFKQEVEQVISKVEEYVKVDAGAT